MTEVISRHIDTRNVTPPRLATISPLKSVDYEPKYDIKEQRKSW